MSNNSVPNNSSFLTPPSPGTQLWVKAEDKRWWPAVVCNPNVDYDVPFLSFAVSANIGAHDMPPDCAVRFYGSDKVFPINSTHRPESIIPIYWALVITDLSTEDPPYISLCCPAEVCETHSCISQLQSEVFEKVFPSQLNVTGLPVLEEQIGLFSALLGYEGRDTVLGEVQSVRLAFNDFWSINRNNFHLDLTSSVRYPAFEGINGDGALPNNKSSLMKASTQSLSHSDEKQRDSLNNEPLTSLFTSSDFKKAIEFLSAMSPADAIVAKYAMGIPSDADLKQTLKDIEAKERMEHIKEQSSIAATTFPGGQNSQEGNLSVIYNEKDSKEDLNAKKQKKGDKTKRREKRKRPLLSSDLDDENKHYNNANKYNSAICVSSQCAVALSSSSDDSKPFIIQGEPWEYDALHHLRYSVFDATLQGSKDVLDPIYMFNDILGATTVNHSDEDNRVCSTQPLWTTVSFNNIKSELLYDYRSSNDANDGISSRIGEGGGTRKERRLLLIALDESLSISEGWMESIPMSNNINDVMSMRVKISSFPLSAPSSSNNDGYSSTPQETSMGVMFGYDVKEGDDKEGNKIKIPGTCTDSVENNRSTPQHMAHVARQNKSKQQHDDKSYTSFTAAKCINNQTIITLPVPENWRLPSTRQKAPKTLIPLDITDAVATVLNEQKNSLNGLLCQKSKKDLNVHQESSLLSLTLTVEFVNVPLGMQVWSGVLAILQATVVPLQRVSNFVLSRPQRGTPTLNEKLRKASQCLKVSKCDDDDELLMDATAAIPVSMSCPLSLTRLELPARGSRCEHLQCMNLDMLLLSCCRSHVWACPLCRGPCPFSEIEVDFELKDIMDKWSDESSSKRVDSAVFIRGAYNYDVKKHQATERDTVASRCNIKVACKQNNDRDDRSFGHGAVVGVQEKDFKVEEESKSYVISLD